MRKPVCLGCGAEVVSGEPHECDRDILDAAGRSGGIGIWPPLATNPPLTKNIIVNVKDGYLDLFTILNRALSQAQDGKGNDRHANGKAFNDQPIMTITRRRGFGFPFGQIEKKVDEAEGMIARNELAAAERELLGAINYAAAAILRLHELEAQKVE